MKTLIDVLAVLGFLFLLQVLGCAAFIAWTFKPEHNPAAKRPRWWRRAPRQPLAPPLARDGTPLGQPDQDRWLQIIYRYSDATAAEPHRRTQ